MDIKQILADVQFLVDVLVVAVMAVVESHVGKGLQSACAIFQSQIAIVVPLVVLPRITGRHQTESVALWLQRLDADDGIHFGIVFRSRSRDHIDALDVDRLQLFQFALIAYLLIIDINLWFAFGQYLELSVTALNHGNHRQQVVGIANVVEQRVLHIDGHTTRSRLILRNLTLDLNAFHHIGLRLEGDGTDVAHTDVSGNGLIADIRHL